MIVKANVLDKNTNLRRNECFLVRFDHTPFHQVKKSRGRKCICTIYWLNDNSIHNNYESTHTFYSDICGKKFKFYLYHTELTCSPEDNYVKAFARLYTLKKTLNIIFNNQNSDSFLRNLPFSFDNETFKSFMQELSNSHSHGMETAYKLMSKENYLITK